jgi:LacI family transcriptional regulator
MSRRFRIALLIESSRGYGRALLRGIAAYARMHSSWVFFHEERSLGAPLPPKLVQWKPDGVIARLAGDALIREVRQLAIPTVDLYREDETQDIPGVTIHQESLVRLAIEHFLERGFRHFAYCGLPGVLFSDLRAKSFQGMLAARGLRADIFTARRLRAGTGLSLVEADAARHADQLAAWLGELPRPVAIWACNDMRAQQVMSVCAENGIAVPDDVAVLGVDNDDVQCELCNPPLSSIDPNVEEIGYQAAALLDCMLAGQPPPKTRILVEPRGVVTRRSTDVLAIADRDVAEAVALVRQHACDANLEIGTLLAQLSFSRSTLDRWFRQWLGRTPAEEVNRVRLARIEELLTTTALPLEEIAQRCGFRHVESMCRMVKRLKGIPPGELRQPRLPL